MGSLNSALLLAVGQVAIMLAVMRFAIGLSVATMLATVCFTLLVAATFMALQQFFQVAFGSAPGKVIVIVLLMVQLASAGGTYPIETTPAFLRVISPYLPMSYAVAGLREAITGGIEGRVLDERRRPGGHVRGGAGRQPIAAARKRTWTMSRLHPALSL